jgi:hypothetical protein
MKSFEVKDVSCEFRSTFLLFFSMLANFVIQSVPKTTVPYHEPFYTGNAATGRYSIKVATQSFS